MSLPLVAIRGEDDARLLAENCQLQRECRQVTVEWMSAMHNWLPDINFEAHNDNHFQASFAASPVEIDDSFDYYSALNYDMPCSDSPKYRIGPSPCHSTDEKQQAKLSPSSNSADETDELVCWDHGCSGRKFATRSNLVRHRREKSNARKEFACLQCNAIFSRSTARNLHLTNGSCGKMRRYPKVRTRQT